MAITSVARFSILWLGIIFLITLLELIYNSNTHHFRQSFFNVLLWALLSDLLFWLKALVFIYPVFTLLYLISSRLARICYYVIGVVLVLLQFGLALYFTTALVPLGGDAFGYSTTDIRQTIGASGVINALNISLIVLFTGLTIAALWFLPKRFKLNKYVIIFLPLAALLALIFDVQARIAIPNLKSDFTNNLVLNKTDYFWQFSAIVRQLSIITPSPLEFISLHPSIQSTIKLLYSVAIHVCFM